MSEMIKDFRYQNIVLTIPAATPVNSALESFLELDRSYNRITGIQISEIDDTILGNALLLGAKSQRRQWIDKIPRSAFNATEGVAPDAKFITTEIPYGSGDIFYLQAQPLAIPASDVIIYMTLRLENSFVELPK